MLAQGGYVKPNTPQLAVIGDNRHQGEVVAPENKLKEMAMAAVQAAGSGVSRDELESIINRAVMRIIAALADMGFYLDSVGGCRCLICGPAWNCESICEKRRIRKITGGA